MGDQVRVEVDMATGDILLTLPEGEAVRMDPPEAHRLSLALQAAQSRSYGRLN